MGIGQRTRGGLVLKSIVKLWTVRPASYNRGILVEANYVGAKGKGEWLVRRQSLSQPRRHAGAGTTYIDIGGNLKG